MKKFLFFCLFYLGVAFLFAQKPLPFASKTINPDKIKVILDFPAEGRNSNKGGGYSANMELVNPKPKKVALVSFYIYDPGCTEAKGGTYTGSVSVAAWRTPEEIAQQHIDNFYEKSLPAMKSKFKEYGIDLLTPDEFITTDEIADFYYSFDQETAKREKSAVTVRKAAGTSISSVAEATVSTLKMSPNGKGYRAFFVANEQVTESFPAVFQNAGVFGANRKMTSSLGYELTKGLGVDAVVICYIVIRKPNKKKDEFGINAVNLFMFGPNPIIEGSDDKNRGQFYCGTRFFSSKPLIYQTEVKKQKEVSYDNIDNVLKVLSERMCKWVIKKEKK